MFYLYVFPFVSPSAQQASYISANFLQNKLSDLHITSYTEGHTVTLQEDQKQKRGDLR